MTEACSGPAFKTVRYTKVVSYGPDGKVLSERRVLDDGGAAKTPEDVRRLEERLEKKLRRLDELLREFGDVF